MNKKPGSPVSIHVRVARFLFFAAPALFLASCSGSRTVGADLKAPPGRTVNKTVVDSDVFIPNGSTLEVLYSSRNRYFVEAGGALVGFKKGVNRSKIYAEKGALIPNVASQSGFTIYTVKDASKSYRDRYKELLPADVQPPNANGGVVAPVVGVGVGVNRGWWGGGWGPWWRGGYRGGGSSRPTSVRSSSYKIKN
ncbi:MAG: hypothetical protein ABF391_13315 [Akkermansiaceae bacterium]